MIGNPRKFALVILLIVGSVMERYVPFVDMKDNARKINWVPRVVMNEFMPT
jgi:hypothetical protein